MGYCRLLEITTVSTWLCKCGLRVKVIGETPKDAPTPTQEAVCPGCGDKQTVYMAKVSSITTEQPAAHQDAHIACDKSADGKRVRYLPEAVWCKAKNFTERVRFGWFCRLYQ